MKKIIIVTTLVIFGIVFSGMVFAQGFSPRNQQVADDQGSGDQDFTPPARGNGQGDLGSEDQDFRPRGNDQDNASHRRPRKPGSPLGKVLHDNMMTEALTELTGETAETVRAELETNGMREFLESYEIDRETLKAKMDEKTVAMIGKLSDCGVITQEQADEILEKMEERKVQDEDA